MLTQDLLKKHIIYNPDTGDLYRVCHTRYHLRIINTKDREGYVRVRFRNKTYGAHRIAWLYMTGKWPEKFVDHIDRNPSNNKWNNLRECDYAQNNRNKSGSSNNTSGYKGVSWHKRAKRWRAEIRVDGKGVHLGYYKTPEAAFAAYCVASRRFHGEFGCAA